MTKRVQWPGRVCKMLLVSALGWGMAASHAAVLVQQAGSALPGVTSATADGGGRAVFDDFVLADGADLTRVEWTGGYVSAATPSGVALAPDVRFFVALRLDDGSGLPDAVPLVQLTDFAAVPRVALSSSDSQAVFRYGLDLGSAISLSANTRYWLQITALLDAVPNDTTLTWDWSRGAGGNGTAARFQPGPGANANGYVPVDSDLSFSLIGTRNHSVDEAPTLALLMLAAGLAAGVRQKRSSSRR